MNERNPGEIGPLLVYKKNSHKSEVSGSEDDR